MDCARYRKKWLPDKEFNAPTKGEAKALLDDWKIKVAIQDAITSNIKIQDYANKYLFRKSLMVEAGKFKLLEATSAFSLLQILPASFLSS